MITGNKTRKTLNGAGNIMRKVIPDSKVYYEGVEAVTIQPIKIKHNLS